MLEGVEIFQHLTRPFGQSCVDVFEVGNVLRSVSHVILKYRNILAYWTSELVDIAQKTASGRRSFFFGLPYRLI